MNDLTGKNLLLIGDSFSGKEINRMIKKLNISEAESKQAVNTSRMMRLFDNPLSKGHHVIVYHLGEEKIADIPFSAHGRYLQSK